MRTEVEADVDVDTPETEVDADAEAAVDSDTSSPAPTSFGKENAWQLRKPRPSFVDTTHIIPNAKINSTE